MFIFQCILLSLCFMQAAQLFANRALERVVGADGRRSGYYNVQPSDARIPGETQQIVGELSKKSSVANATQEQKKQLAQATMRTAIIHGPNLPFQYQEVGATLREQNHFKCLRIIRDVSNNLVDQLKDTLPVLSADQEELKGNMAGPINNQAVPLAELQRLCGISQDNFSAWFAQAACELNAGLTQEPQWHWHQSFIPGAKPAGGNSGVGVVPLPPVFGGVSLERQQELRLPHPSPASAAVSDIIRTRESRIPDLIYIRNFLAGKCSQLRINAKDMIADIDLIIEAVRYEQEIMDGFYLENVSNKIDCRCRGKAYQLANDVMFVEWVDIQDPLNNAIRDVFNQDKNHVAVQSALARSAEILPKIQYAMRLLFIDLPVENLIQAYDAFKNDDSKLRTFINSGFAHVGCYAGRVRQMESAFRATEVGEKVPKEELERLVSSITFNGSSQIDPLISRLAQAAFVDTGRRGRPMAVWIYNYINDNALAGENWARRINNCNEELMLKNVIIPSLEREEIYHEE